ncbi:unnamed protein product [Cyprideis torosa]|uniref:ubiquitinyl hydrolase 1 n=1 Tax=Cyprideis torosa TaxID=163714 RepID=A0A7R8WDY1_9CRUS|nr:unnamed protein product [Cyprideis torosa]CAG0895210.1 unnamed protein product [Cyprideis torosa]
MAISTRTTALRLRDLLSISPRGLPFDLPVTRLTLSLERGDVLVLEEDSGWRIPKDSFNRPQQSSRNRPWILAGSPLSVGERAMSSAGLSVACRQKISASVKLMFSTIWKEKIKFSFLRYATAIDRLLLTLETLETYIRTVEAEEVSWGGSLPHCHSAGFIGCQFLVVVVVYATNSNSVPLGVPGAGNAGPVVQGPSLPPGAGSPNSGGGGDRQSDVKIATHSNEPLCTFRARLAAMLNVSSLHNMKLMRRSQNYPDEDLSPVSIQNTHGHTLMGQLLEEHGFDEVALRNLLVVMSVVLPGNHNADLSVFAVPEPPSTPGGGGPSTSGGGVASSNRFSHAEFLFSAIMGSNSKVFTMLQRIANLDETRLLPRIRRLLRLLPTDPEVSDALDAIFAAPSASADANPKLSPRISPRPEISAEEKEKRQRMLREFLKRDQPPFSLLYRLETLWGRLLPPANVYSAPSASGSALFFREDFIASGCLTVVLDLFGKNLAVIQKAIASSISSLRPISPTSVSVIVEQHPELLISLKIIRPIINREAPLTKGSVAEELAVLLRHLWCGRYRSLSPKEFQRLIAGYCKTFAGYDQHDAHELLMILLDWLHDDLNRCKIYNLSSYARSGQSPPPYKLYAVTIHTGTMDGGHYTAICRNPAHLAEEKWFEFDDHDVKDYFDEGARLHTGAYILYYCDPQLLDHKNFPAPLVASMRNDGEGGGGPRVGARRFRRLGHDVMDDLADRLTATKF